MPSLSLLLASLPSAAAGQSRLFPFLFFFLFFIPSRDPKRRQAEQSFVYMLFIKCDVMAPVVTRQHHRRQGHVGGTAKGVSSFTASVGGQEGETETLNWILLRTKQMDVGNVVVGNVASSPRVHGYPASFAPFCVSYTDLVASDEG